MSTDTRSLGARLVKKLTGSAGQAVVLPGTNCLAGIETESADRLGILLLRVHLDEVTARLAARELRRRLDALAAKIDYLPEQLEMVEHDPAHTGALMRSTSPRKLGDDREYFELRVERDLSLSFQRYRQPPGGAHRQVSPTLLDRTTLTRLVDDLAGIVRE